MIDTYVRCNSVIVHNDANDGDDKQIENKRDDSMEGKRLEKKNIKRELNL